MGKLNLATEEVLFKKLEGTANTRTGSSGTWLGDRGGVGLEVGLDALQGLLQPKQFQCSMDHRMQQS